MVAVVTHKPGVKGKRYRVATDADLTMFCEKLRSLPYARKEDRN